jgi:transcriptional regulator with XRE-family HTH domain
MTETITQTQHDSFALSPGYPVGRYISLVREKAGLTQAELAHAITFSTATLSRIESGDKLSSADEIHALLQAIGTPEAVDLREFLGQEWDEVERPAFDHPDRATLWQANLALRKLAALSKDGNLKAVFLRQIELHAEEIQRITKFLGNRDQQIACIGSIGVGKSTAICKLTGLLKEGAAKLDHQIVLETGAGGITLCEVHISQGPKYGLRIVARTEESIRRDVEDFCDYLINSTRPAPASTKLDPEEEGDPLGISKEVVRAIRNMAGLGEKRREENGRRIRFDPAKELAKEHSNPQELCIAVLTRMDLLRRNRRDAWYPDDCQQSPAHWLQDLFAAVNNGRNSEFTLPQKIEIIVPESVLASHEFQFRIIDTKGIDQTAGRQDLECHFDDPRTLVVLCSGFNDAPEVALQSLLRRAKEAGARDVNLKTVLLVLARPDEALAVKYDDGTRVDTDEEGYDLKRDQVHLRLNQQGLSEIPVVFFNARDERPDDVREQLIGQVRAHRRHYAERIAKIANAIDRLERNRSDEEIRIVFEHVLSDINAWISANRDIDLSEKGVEEPLVEAIGGTRYASTIRAAVRRTGDWYNLDYYHHLAYGVRKLGVDQIGTRIDDLKVIVGNLINNAELSSAKEFLVGILERVDVALDESYRRLQASGRETFKQTLAKDFAFWAQCDGRWGQGPGYRDAIQAMTDAELEQQREELKALLCGLLVTEWRGIVSLMTALLQEKQSPAV